MAVSAANDRDIGRAFALIRREVIFDPGNPGVICDAFSIGARLGHAGATRLAVWATRVHPLFLAGWRHQLDTRHQSATPAGHRSIPRRICVLSPGDAVHLRQSGQAMMGMGEYALATQVLGWACLVLSKDVSALFSLAQARFQSRDHAGALAALDQARDAGLPEEQERFWRARLMMATGRHGEADMILEEAERAGGALAERCHILAKTARPSDFKAPAPGTRS
jgi:tetratricopeptide (TPR) repeat protein